MDKEDLRVSAGMPLDSFGCMIPRPDAWSPLATMGAVFKESIRKCNARRLQQVVNPNFQVPYPLKQISYKLTATGCVCGDGGASMKSSAYITELRKYLRSKEDAGLIRGVFNWNQPHRVFTIFVPHIRMVFDTHAGTLNQILMPWLRQYAAEWRLQVRVQVSELGEPDIDNMFHVMCTRQERTLLPADQNIVVVLTELVRCKRGSVRFIDRYVKRKKKQHERHNPSRRVKALARHRRLAQQDAFRHRARAV